MKNMLIVLMVVLSSGCSKKQTKIEMIEQIKPPIIEKKQVTVDKTDNRYQDYVDTMTVYFDFDSYTIRQDQLATLNSIAKKLLSDDNLNITISGGACPIGTDDWNLHLGQARALAVQKYLVTSGISPVRIAVYSYGESNLVSDDIETYWKNRRGECVIEVVK